MDIHFFDSAPVPKEQVRIEELEVVVYPDRFRIFIHIRVSLFQERPNLLLVARAHDGQIAAELNVIETMHHDMEFTMHLRGRDDTAGQYALVAELFYDTRNPPQDRREQSFAVPPETGDT
ncbi:MAG: hypothetical protein JNL42_23945 [Anaerolineae bacterium]|nr:hypothetical protein [Anaerolineae bacterium]